MPHRLIPATSKSRHENHRKVKGSDKKRENGWRPHNLAPEQEARLQDQHTEEVFDEGSQC